MLENNVIQLNILDSVLGCLISVCVITSVVLSIFGPQYVFLWFDIMFFISFTIDMFILLCNWYSLCSSFSFKFIVYIFVSFLFPIIKIIVFVLSMCYCFVVCLYLLPILMGKLVCVNVGYFN